MILQCSICKEFKEGAEFYKRPTRKRGYSSQCKKCTQPYKIQWRKKNKERSKIVAKRSYDIKGGKEKARVKRYKKIEHYRAYQRKWIKEQRKENPQIKIAGNLRIRICTLIKKNKRPGSAIKDLGCTLTELKLHLEKQFKEGMTWNNHGNRRGQWSIDHIIPLSKVNLSNREQFLKVCHYTNLQPLWMEDNVRKWNHI